MFILATFSLKAVSVSLRRELSMPSPRVRSFGGSTKMPRLNRWNCVKDSNLKLDP
jgi:hypothetical protein